MAFLLEASGYLAMPYLALHLRESFNISEVKIGLYFMIGIWLRPVWAMGSAALAKWIKPGRLIQIGALISGLSICALSVSREPIIAFFAVIFANFGLSIWSPSTYAYAYGMFGSGDESKKQISTLNFCIYMGAAIGSGIASLLANSQRDFIFLAAGASFLIAFAFGSFLNQKMNQISDSSTAKEGSTPFEWKKMMSSQVIFLCIATAFFWGSYAQFNSFFSLFAQDWLKNPGIVGVAFSFMTLFVAGASLAISRYQSLQKNDVAIAIGVIFLTGILWATMLTTSSTAITWAFLIGLGLSEAFFVLAIAHLWAKQSEKQAHFMQSLNYSFCNIGMGAGAALGGYLYKSPDKGQIYGFAIENLTFCLIASASLVIIAISLKKNSNEKL